MTTRSPAFDLLFEDARSTRTQDILPYLEDVEMAGIDLAHHRMTIFLTYQCNLACPYCKTIVTETTPLSLFPQKAGVMSLSQFCTLLDTHRAGRIAHLHFTGGEPALHPDLPEMIRYALSSGTITHCSLTSNGTLSLKIYAALVEAGIAEIRISLDAATPSMGRLMSGGRSHAWARAVATIQGLVRMRDAGAPFVLLANAVIAPINRGDMVAIVRFILDLGVNDLRLLCVADQKQTLWDFPEGRYILSELEQCLASFPPSVFPLLRMKLVSVFVPEETGVQGLEDPAGKTWRCYIPLTERTYDSTYYYPCSNYLREGGHPLGAVEDSWDVQHAKSVAFVKDFQPLGDPICQRYCSHCTKQFNVMANKAR